MAGNEEPPSFDEFDRRLAEQRGAKASATPEPAVPGAGGTRLGDGFQVGIELVAGVVGGVGIGWVLDAWLDTRPLFLILLFVLGAAGGMMNAARWLRRAGQADGR